MDVIKKFRETKNLFKQGEEQLQLIKEEIGRLEDQYQNKIEDLAEKLHLSSVDVEHFKKFLNEPYVLLPAGKKEEWYVAVPKFIRMNLGWLDFTTDTYNVFRINKFIDWLGDIPKEIREKFKFKQKLPFKIFDGMMLTGSEHQDTAWTRYNKHLSRREGKEKIRITRGHEFQLIAKLIDDGILPFIAQPVDKEDLRKAEVNFELREYQEDAHKIFLKTGAVGIYWSFSAGKTFFGMYASAEIKGPKLVVVPTTTLVEQWRERFEEYTNISKEVEIVTYHSYHKIQDNEYSLIIFDECLTGDTIITLQDGGFEKIRDINNNQKVLGGKVINKFDKIVKETIKITTSFSELETTITHPHIVLKRKRDKHNNQWFKITEKDIHIVPSEKLILKDCLLIPHSLPHIDKTSWTSDQLAFVALIACDGHIEKNKNVIKVAVSKKGEKEWIRDVFINGMKSFLKDNGNFWEFTNKRGDYTIGCSSKKLKEILNNVFLIPDGKKSSIIDIPNEIFYAPLKSIKSFIDVCFSCESNLTEERNKSKRIYFSSVSKNYIVKLQLLLKKFGIHSNRTMRYRSGKNHNDVYHIYIGGKDFNNLMDLLSFLREKLNTTKRNKGRYLNNEVVFRKNKYRIVPIKKIEKKHINKKVYDFSSDPSHIFIANGSLTHNCHHLPANVFSKFSTIRAKYRIGLSGSPYREDGRTDYIFALTGFPIGLSWDNLIELGVIEKPDIRLYIFTHWRDKEKKLQELLSINKKTIVFCDSIPTGKRLSKQYEVPFVYGDTRDRLEIIKNSETTIVSRVGDEGLSIPDIERIIEFDFLFGSRRQEVQRMGRILHGKSKGEHNILMTEAEYQNYSKRLMGLYEKGFKIEIVR